mmetsp:Transcript_45671/g.74479  ORF Transcript_45671/g.74479 Transcript_45671/m.74479 type:complete len:355 (+) Transcript_45671:3-1067(+)|eukprot:CAMPEP_0184336342 /NCGR_PEP_ID=MMETSP1089-20130417/4673_1 /TAXON_ID=38269 ORGANISM="Gloeochaete wittrockiana, Strain SAG46.84" /NCGR_SAMPLE_ID=MMETSP1089 /ASSEMBLY_ACC=CAM_ASM_000445 /LENGTH=354 /DNA_ID=CAMNT_0026661337 /DNA_START=15 /DNA_END=1079 /DNA_ORIENTATION=+
MTDSLCETLSRARRSMAVVFAKKSVAYKSAPKVNGNMTSEKPELPIELSRGENPFGVLPDDVLGKLLTFCGEHTHRMRLVCKLWRNAIDEYRTEIRPSLGYRVQSVDLAVLCTYLMRCSRLCALHLHDVYLRTGSIGYSAFASYLSSPAAAHVSVLQLDYVNLGPLGANVLATGLQSTCHIEVLSLAGNRMSGAGANALLEALAGKRTLSSLVLTNNRLDDTHGKALGLLLGSCPGLTNLQLADNNLGPRAIECLAESIPFHRNLRALSLACNPITRLGAIALAKGLIRNVSLRELNLQYCGVDEAGMEALAHALCDTPCNTTLLSLNLTLNPIPSSRIQVSSNVCRVYFPTAH